MNKKSFLKIGLLLSALIHVFVVFLFFNIQKNPIKTRSYNKSILVKSVSFKSKAKEEKKEEKAPKPLPKPAPKKVKKKRELPVSHIRKESERVEDVKPVFGVTKKSVDEKMTQGIGVRVGNTLMKEMEKEYTPPEKVKDYAAGKKIREVGSSSNFNPVALSKIVTMPQVINPKRPSYPKLLEEEEIEGTVILELSISKKGEVIKVKVIESDHELFSKSAIKSVKNYKFKPAKLADGTSADAVIEFTVKFEMPL